MARQIPKVLDIQLDVQLDVQLGVQLGDFFCSFVVHVVGVLERLPLLHEKCHTSALLSACLEEGFNARQHENLGNERAASAAFGMATICSNARMAHMMAQKANVYTAVDQGP